MHFHLRLQLQSQTKISAKNSNNVSRVLLVKEGLQNGDLNHCFLIHCVPQPVHAEFVSRPTGAGLCWSCVFNNVPSENIIYVSHSSCPSSSARMAKSVSRSIRSVTTGVSARTTRTRRIAVSFFFFLHFFRREEANLICPRCQKGSKLD